MAQAHPRFPRVCRAHSCVCSRPSLARGCRPGGMSAHSRRWRQRSGEGQLAGKPGPGASELRPRVIATMLSGHGLAPENAAGSSVAEIKQRADEVCVFLLVCGLRRVKDPLFLVDAFSGRPRTPPAGRSPGPWAVRPCRPSSRSAREQSGFESALEATRRRQCRGADSLVFHFPVPVAIEGIVQKEPVAISPRRPQRTASHARRFVWCVRRHVA